jgi:hypothetical protein
MRITLLAVGVLFLGSISAVGSTRSADQAAIKRLIGSAQKCMQKVNVGDQTGIWKACEELGAPSRVFNMVVAAHNYRIHESAAQKKALLNAAPTSAVEMEAFYEFTHRRGNEGLVTLYESFYPSLFVAAESSPVQLSRILSVATSFDTKRWVNYDEADMFCSLLPKLRDSSPAVYDRIVRQKSLGAQKFLKECASETKH